MIKILSVYETPPFDENDVAKLHVDLEIDGYRVSKGGLPVEWTVSELNAYLEANEADMLRQAKLDPPKEIFPKSRYDLGNALPDSEHPAKLIAVNPALPKPATVRRWHEGIAYDVNCLVTQTIVNMWLANPKELNIGDWVLVSFLDELTATDEKHIAIVTDKIFESWG